MAQGATCNAQPVAGAVQIKADFATELAKRMPAKPIAELANDYPGTDVSQFGIGVTAEHMTTYGLVVDGTNYTSTCATRFGQYPYCGWMRLPSYSTAKSFFAGVAPMALAEQYDYGIYDLLVTDFVPEAANADGDWSGLTFENAVDMVTGNYQSALYMVDDSRSTMDNEFYLVET